MGNDEKPLIEASGGIHIGRSFLKSFQASWPFGKIEVYDDYLVLKIQYLPGFILRWFEKADKFPAMMGTYNDIPDRIRLNYTDIKYYKEKDLSALGYGLTFVHRDEESAPFLQIWISKDTAKKITDFLNQKGIAGETDSN
jgi:hypothetical protein